MSNINDTREEPLILVTAYRHGGLAFSSYAHRITAPDGEEHRAVIIPGTQSYVLVSDLVALGYTSWSAAPAGARAEDLERAKERYRLAMVALQRTWNVPADIELSLGDIPKLIEWVKAEDDKIRADEPDIAKAMDRLTEERNALQARIAAAMKIPDRREVVPIEDASQRHAYLRGYRDARDDFRAVLEGFK